MTDAPGIVLSPSIYRSNLQGMKQKFTVLLALLIIGLGTAIYIKGNNTYFEDSDSRLPELPLDSTVERGIEYVYADKPDSALACFKAVTSRYTPSMSRTDKIVCAQAFNCLGYVQLFDKRQRSHALISLMKAEQIESETGDSTWLPLIYLNMANAYTYSDDTERVIRLNRRAAHLASRHKAWRTYLTAFRNLAFQTIMEKDASTLREDLDQFASLHIPEANMRGFAQCMYDGGKALLENRWDDAYGYFLKADSLNDAELTPDRSHVMSVLLRSRVLQLRGEPRLAIKEIQDNLHDFKDEQLSSAYLILSRLYDSVGEKDLGAACKLKYYENSDSLDMLAAPGQLAAAESQFRLGNASGNGTRQPPGRNNRVAVTLCVLTAAMLCAALLAAVRFRKRALRKKRKKLPQTASHDSGAESTPSGQDMPEDKEALHIMEVLENSPAIFEVGFSIEKAAMLTGVHSRRISKILNRAYRKNFNAVLQELRIKEACRLLASPDTAQSLNMSGIAASLGFKSRTYFCEVFKKQTGLTPTEYMRSARQPEK